MARKESACSAGDPGLIPGWERSEGGPGNTPAFLPGESRGQRSLRGYKESLCHKESWCHKESDTAEQLALGLQQRRQII